MRHLTIADVSNDATLSANSGTLAVSQYALKTYVAGQLANLGGGTGPTNPVTPGSFTQPDPSLNRVDTSIMTVVNVTSTSQLQSLATSAQTNKHFVLGSGTYGPVELTGAWSNCWLDGQNKQATIRNDSTAVALKVQTATFNKVWFSGINFASTTTGGNYPMVFSNELTSFTGWEISGCDFTCPNGQFNAFGIIQYSTVSNSGGTSRDLYLHDNTFHNIGRMGMEILSQGYDSVRIQNVTISNNTFSDLGKNDEYGMAFSFSGLIRTIGTSGNTCSESRKVAYEFVNVQDVVASNNSATATVKGTVGYGISDDSHHTTRNLTITGGTFDVTERPFYIYGSDGITINGGNALWKGHRGVQMQTVGSSFSNLNLLIHSTTVEASWEWGSGTTTCTANSCTVSSAGAAAAGYEPAFETVVLRPGANNNTLSNLTTIVGKRANGTVYADQSSGGNGAIVVKDGANGNTVTNNLFSVAS